MVNIILGGGLVGTIASFYLNNFLLITERREPTKFVYGPIYLYRSPYSQTLLNDLNISSRCVWINSAVSYQGQIVKFDDHLRKIYEQKIGRKSNLAGKGRGLPAFDVDLRELHQTLIKAVWERTIEDRIEKIDLHNKILIGREREYRFDKLISTIPLPEFLRMCGVDNVRFNYHTLYFVVVNGKKIHPLYDYIYYIDEDTPERPYYRATYHKHGDYTVFESLTPFEVEGGIDYHLNLFGKILDERPPKVSFESVYFLGRFGRWEYGRKIHDDIKEILKLKGELKGGGS